MSIAAKTVFTRDLENQLGTLLTADILRKAMQMIGESLVNFDMEELAEAERGEDLLEAFISAKEIEGRSKKTMERYRYILHRFFEATHTDTRHVTVYHIRSYLMAEKQRGITENTLEGYRCVFSSYFGWLHKEGLIQSNPCGNLGAIKCPKVVREPYSATDIERLREACESLRDRAIIAFLLSTGCRISEVCGLNRTDIDFQSGECTVLGKGNKERIVFLDSVAVMLLKRYLNNRKDLEPALFVGKRQERLQPGGVRAMLKQLEIKTGVPNVHSHRFRRTLATNLITRGMVIQEVAAVLGHDKLDTTMKYVYLDKSTVRNSYRKYA